VPRPAPNSQSAVGQHVQRRHALGHHEGVVARQQNHSETEPYALRTLRCGCEEHLGTRAMADLGEEVLFSQPEVAEPGMFGRNHMVQVLPIHIALGVDGPWPWHLNLTEQTELHCCEARRDAASPNL
jgi:hypothetical protein